MVEFFLNNLDLVKDIVVFILAVIAFIVTLFTRRNVTSAVKDFKEVEDLKYRTVNKFKSADTVQEFTPYVKDYVLNPQTNELEELPVPKNVQDYIQSFVDCALERFKEKYLPQNVQESDLVADYASSVSDLSSLAEAMETAEYYREKFSLPDDYSMADIYQFVDKQANSLKAQLKLKRENKNQEVSDVESEKTKVKS